MFAILFFQTLIGQTSDKEIILPQMPLGSPETREIDTRMHNVIPVNQTPMNGLTLKEIENLFSGRKRRGQGQFKLSTQPTVKNQWFDVLKKVDD